MGVEWQFATVVVDDDSDARFLISRALDRSGRFVVVGEAADGDEAAAVCRDTCPEVVVLDLNLGGEDGLAVLPRVRAVCPADSVIVVMSADVHADVSDDVTDRGGAAFIPKDPGYSRLVRELLALADDAIPDAGGGPTARWHLPAHATSGARCRRRSRGLLDGWQLPHVLDDAALVATELINNAVVHAHSDVLITAERRPGALRIAVADNGVGTPHRPNAGLDATHGRGLLLVEALSSGWGTAVNGDVDRLVRPARTLTSRLARFRHACARSRKRLQQLTAAAGPKWVKLSRRWCRLAGRHRARRRRASRDTGRWRRPGAGRRLPRARHA